MLKIKIFSAILLVLLSNAAFCGNNNDTGYFSGRDLHLKAEQLTSYQPQTDQYIFVLDQQVSLAFGADTYSADKAVIWLETVGSQYLGKTSIDYQVNAYLQGNIVQNKNKHISAIKSRSIDGGSQMTLQFRVNGEVFLTADTKQTLDPRDTDFYKQARSSIVSDKPLFVIQPGAVVPGLADKTSDLQETKIAGKKKKSFFSRIFKTKTADTNTSTETATQPGQVPPAETAVEQKAAKAPKFTYPIGIAPATDTPIELQSAA
nr:hypothetical protein [Planctomycetota bacterium]